MTVPTPPDFAYYPDVVLRDDFGAPAIWHIAIFDVVEIELLHFLAAAHDSAMDFACVGNCMDGNGWGMLVPSPPGERREMGDIGLLKIIGGSVFDPVAAFIAYCRYSDVGWAWIEPVQRWYPYQLTFRRVMEVL